MADLRLSPDSTCPAASIYRLPPCPSDRLRAPSRRSIRPSISLELTYRDGIRHEDAAAHMIDISARNIYYVLPGARRRLTGILDRLDPLVTLRREHLFSLLYGTALPNTGAVQGCRGGLLPFGPGRSRRSRSPLSHNSSG